MSVLALLLALGRSPLGEDDPPLQNFEDVDGREALEEILGGDVMKDLAGTAFEGRWSDSDGDDEVNPFDFDMT